MLKVRLLCFEGLYIVSLFYSSFQIASVRNTDFRHVDIASFCPNMIEILSERNVCL